MFDTKSLIPWAGAGPSTLVRLVAGQLASYNAASGVWTSTSAILWSNACVSVSNGHSVKHRPRIARNQDERLFPSQRYVCPSARLLHRTCVWKRQIDVSETLPFEEGAAVERLGGRRDYRHRRRRCSSNGVERGRKGTVWLFRFEPMLLFICVVFL
jgi:hypothetical protein